MPINIQENPEQYIRHLRREEEAALRKGRWDLAMELNQNILKTLERHDAHTILRIAKARWDIMSPVERDVYPEKPRTSEDLRSCVSQTLFPLPLNKNR